MEVCATPTDDLPSHQNYATDVCVTPCSNVSIKEGEDDKLLHQDTFPEENYSNTCMNSNKHGHSFQPFELYVLCDKLRTGMGTALVDTGYQVSLVTEHCLNKGSVIKKQTMKIHGITGNAMETKEQIELRVGESSPLEFLVVKTLPLNCDILLGQDWLERFGYQFQIPSLGITLPAYSETVVSIPTTEQGSPLVEAQELQENVFCASSVVDCKGSSFLCLIVNCNSI